MACLILRGMLPRISNNGWGLEINETVHITRSTIPASRSIRKWRINWPAINWLRSFNPTSMFLSCPASVKMADDTKTCSVSTTTHLACKDERTGPHTDVHQSALMLADPWFVHEIGDMSARPALPRWLVRERPSSGSHVPDSGTSTACDPSPLNAGSWRAGRGS